MFKEENVLENSLGKTKLKICFRVFSQDIIGYL